MLKYAVKLDERKYMKNNNTFQKIIFLNAECRHFRIPVIAWYSGSPSHTLSIPRLWKRRLQCVLYTKKEIPPNCLHSALKNILVFKTQLSFHPILHHI